MIRLGLVQASSVPGAAQNYETLQQYAAKAKAQACAAVCFPEAFLTGYAPEQADRYALSVSSPEILQVTRLAQELEIDILVGFMETDGALCYLTQGVFRSDGTVSQYRKTHLGAKERLYFAEGNSLEVYSLSCGLPFGFQMCVETHFPEITQTLALKGAEVVFSPHAAPGSAEKRKTIWNKYIPARSYDYRIYMACCNQWDGTHFGGGCLVTDPQGVMICEYFENRDTLVIFEADRNLVAHYHTDTSSSIAHRFYPARRRRELYL